MSLGLEKLLKHKLIQYLFTKLEFCARRDRSYRSCFSRGEAQGLVRRARTSNTSTHSRKGRRAVEVYTKNLFNWRCMLYWPTISIVRGERRIFNPDGTRKRQSVPQGLHPHLRDTNDEETMKASHSYPCCQNRCLLRWAAVTPRAVQVQQLVPKRHRSQVTSRNR